MNIDEKRLLGCSDLDLLCSTYCKTVNRGIEAQEIHDFSLEDNACDDLWSDALLSVSEKDQEKIRIMRAAIRHSKYQEEVKRWWDVVFAMSLDASEEELSERIQLSDTMPDIMSLECLPVAASRIAEKRVKKLAKERRIRAREERIQIEELERSRQKAEQRLEDAQRNLKSHRDRRGQY